MRMLTFICFFLLPLEVFSAEELDGFLRKKNAQFFLSVKMPSDRAGNYILKGNQTDFTRYQDLYVRVKGLSSNCSEGKCFEAASLKPALYDPLTSKNFRHQRDTQKRSL